MGFPPDYLLSNDPPPAIDRILLVQMLKRLSDDDIAKARRVLTQHLGLDAVSEAKKRYVTLIGLRGAGKTTLGRRLAKHRGAPFFGLDPEVGRENGATVGGSLHVQ